MEAYSNPQTPYRDFGCGKKGKRMKRKRRNKKGKEGKVGRRGRVTPSNF